MAASSNDDEALGFGPFRLVMRERLLTKNGVPVDLGGRAMDILITLASSPNEVVSKKTLMARVWPDVVVEEGSLRFHMTGLRRALGDGEDGARYVTTIAGRGYCFVAPITKTGAPTSQAASEFPHANLPPRLARMIGRNEDIAKLSAHLEQSRLVTIVGPGGVGKTTVAIAVAHRLANGFEGAVLFVDFGMVGEPRLAATAVASMVGLAVQSEDPTSNLVQFLRRRRVLLILDTCEHLVEAVANLAATIAEGAPEAHILATSREALHIDGEQIYRLDSLLCPPEGSGPTAATLGEFPATQLFVERAAAGGAKLEVGDSEAAIVCDICRKLDGVALAIELAARRVDSHGLGQTAALLDQRLALLWQGSRTAPPRHKTLHAALDWSYELLSELERVVLRRLAVFVGHFTLDAALDVTASAALDRQAVFAAVDSLVEKSMVAARPLGAMMRYRLLDTTRAYALDLTVDEAETAELAVRHADYYRRWLEQSGDEWSSLSTGSERAPHFAALNNVRAALEWCFDEKGDASIGIGLAAAAAPVFRAMGLLPECQRWSERALSAFAEANRGGTAEMHLQASLGLCLMFAGGHSDAAIAALNRSLEIAKTRGDKLNEARLLGPLYFYYLRSGKFRDCLQYAERCSKIARDLDDVSVKALAHSLLGVSFSILGNLVEARAELDAALGIGASPAGRTVYFGFDHFNWAGIAKLTTLWLQGHLKQATEAIHKAFRDAEAIQHPVAFAIAVNAIAALLWIGDLELAEDRLNWFISRVESASFAPYLHMGRAFKAEIAIRRGDIEAGVMALQEQLKKLHAARYELFTTRFHVVLASGLLACGRHAEAITLANETVALIDAKGYSAYMPELLRVKGSICRELPSSSAEAEACFLQSLELSRTQGARVWEVRAATDLASLWASQGRVEDARALLRPTVDSFIEGFETTDLSAAKAVLARVT
jgi:predicted ATPase/DNA-binding winged helix-turn-helix (wHTH) protein